jgi:hypothetical protein
MKAKSGMMDCLVIPIELNNLFKGDKGVYLDLIAFELANKKENSKDTHLVKQSLNKEKRESMTEDDLKNMPILGNHSVWSDGQNSQEPVSNSAPISEVDDLPF